MGGVRKCDIQVIPERPRALNDPGLQVALHAAAIQMF